MLHCASTQLTQPQKIKKISRATRKSSFLVTLKLLTNTLRKQLPLLGNSTSPPPRIHTYPGDQVWLTVLLKHLWNFSPLLPLPSFRPSSFLSWITASPPVSLISLKHPSQLKHVISLKHPSHLATLLLTSLQPCSRLLPGFSPNPPAWFKMRATKPRRSSAGEDVEPPELSYIAGRKAGRRATLERQFGSFL